MGTEFLVPQSHCHLLCGIMTCAKLSCDFVVILCFSLMMGASAPLFIPFSCSISQSTTAWMICNVCVSILKTFDPPSDTAGDCTHGEATHRYLQLRYVPSQAIQSLQVGETVCHCQPFCSSQRWGQ